MGHELSIDDINRIYDGKGKLQEIYLTAESEKNDNEVRIKLHEKELQSVSLLKIQHEINRNELLSALPQFEEQYEKLKLDQETSASLIKENKSYIYFLYKIVNIMNSDEINEIETDIDFERMGSFSFQGINKDLIKLFFDALFSYKNENKKLDDLNKLFDSKTLEEEDVLRKLEESKKSLNGKSLPKRGSFFGWWGLDGDSPEESKIRRSYIVYADHLEKIIQEKESLRKQVDAQSKIRDFKYKTLIYIKSDFKNIDSDIKKLIESQEMKCLKEKANKEIIDLNLQSIENLIKNKRKDLFECEIKIDEYSKLISNIENEIKKECILLEQSRSNLNNAKQKLDFYISQIAIVSSILVQMGISIPSKAVQSRVLPSTATQNILPFLTKTKEAREQELSEINKFKIVGENKEKNERMITPLLERRKMKKQEDKEEKRKELRKDLRKDLKKDHCSLNVNKEVAETLNRIFGNRK